MVELIFPNMNDERRAKLREAKHILKKLGVDFDVAFNLKTNERIWQLNYSLKGARIELESSGNTKIKINPNEKHDHKWEIYNPEEPSIIIEGEPQLFKCSKCGGITFECPKCKTYMQADLFLLAMSKWECPKCRHSVRFKNIE